MPEPSSIGVAIVLAAAAAVLLILWRTGGLSTRAFDHAPPRRGHMGLLDLLFGFGLWILGPSVAAVLLAQIAPPNAASDPRWMLWTMLATQAGMLPAIAYTLWRASTAVEGGLTGFGIGQRGLVRGATAAFLGALAIIPLTAAVSLVISGITRAWGDESPEIAHGLLRVLADTPSSPLRWGLIFTAVIAAPVLEEILFRGLLQTTLLQSRLPLGRWGIILLASVIFTLIHVSALMVPAENESSPGPPTDTAQVETEPQIVDQTEDASPILTFAWQALPVLFVLSLGLGYAYERTGTLWAPIGMHAIFNGLQIAIALTAFAPQT